MSEIVDLKVSWLEGTVTRTTAVEDELIASWDLILDLLDEVAELEADLRAVYNE